MLFLNMLISFIYLLADCSGKGNNDPVPQYQEDPATASLKRAVSSKTQSLLNIPYEDLVSRFTPSDNTQGLFNDITAKYKGLLDNQDYSTTDYSTTEKNYLDQVLSRYDEARNKSLKPIQESLIANKLDSSGPGYGILQDYAKETASGVKDITTQWAYEGIQRQQTQQQYMDALKRGDYSTMYNLALSEANREVQPQKDATQTELGYLGAGNSLFGNLNQVDLSKYNAALDAYKINAANKTTGNLGGLGSALGLGLGALFAAPTGGLSMLAGSAIGGGIGGGVGSMIQY